jgi:hypothetical protein
MKTFTVTIDEAWMYQNYKDLIGMVFDLQEMYNFNDTYNIVGLCDMTDGYIRKKDIDFCGNSAKYPEYLCLYEPGSTVLYIINVDDIEYDENDEYVIDVDETMKIYFNLIDDSENKIEFQNS